MYVRTAADVRISGNAAEANMPKRSGSPKSFRRTVRKARKTSAQMKGSCYGSTGRSRQKVSSGSPNRIWGSPAFSPAEKRMSKRNTCCLRSDSTSINCITKFKQEQSKSIFVKKIKKSVDIQKSTWYTNEVAWARAQTTRAETLEFIRVSEKSSLTIKQWNNLENSKKFQEEHQRCSRTKPLTVKDKKLASF